MGAKCKEEYWAFIRYRDHWAEELAGIGRVEAQLQEQAMRLETVVTRLREQSSQLAMTVSTLVSLVQASSSWKGARAREVFRECTEGELYSCYRQVLEKSETVLQQLEDRLGQVKAQLEQAAIERTAADHYLQMWSEKVDTYWY